MRTILLISILVLALFSCQTPIKENPSEKIDYLALGDSISLVSQQALLKEVGTRLQSLGTIPTINYCNIHALQITDSLSKKYGVEISRISMKYRNPKNAPSKNEERLLSQFEVGMSKDGILENTEGAIYYKAIHLEMPACITCHGKPGIDIDNSTLKVIDSLYPGDLARGYSFGDFRGAWKIRFKKQ